MYLHALSTSYFYRFIRQNDLFTKPVWETWNKMFQELEHMRKVHEMNEEEAVRSYATFKKKLPKDFRTESKTRILMFKESLRISCQVSPSRSEWMSDFYAETVYFISLSRSNKVLSILEVTSEFTLKCI